MGGWFGIIDKYWLIVFLLLLDVWVDVLFNNYLGRDEGMFIVEYFGMEMVVNFG